MMNFGSGHNVSGDPFSFLSASRYGMGSASNELARRQAAAKEEMARLTLEQQDLDMAQNPAFNMNAVNDEIRDARRADMGMAEGLGRGRGVRDSVANVTYLNNLRKMDALEGVAKGTGAGVWRVGAGATSKPQFAISDNEPQQYGGQQMTGRNPAYNWGRMEQESALLDLKQKGLQTDAMERALTPMGREADAYEALRMAKGPSGEMQDIQNEKALDVQRRSGLAQLQVPDEHLLSPLGHLAQVARSAYGRTDAWNKAAPMVEAAEARAAGTIGAAQATGQSREAVAATQAAVKLAGEYMRLQQVLRDPNLLTDQQRVYAQEQLKAMEEELARMTALLPAVAQR